jgi:hypothetical protein
MKKVELGDMIFRSQYSSVSKAGVIDRVTEKFAFIGSTKFNRYFSNKYFVSVPRTQWSTTYYFIPTIEDIKEYNHQNRVYFLSKFDFSKLESEKIETIYQIVKGGSNLGC